MAQQFLNKKTHPFYFVDPADDERKSYRLIFGDEVNTLSGAAPSGTGWSKVEYRGRTGEMENPVWTTKRSLEMYFLDVEQGDAAFIITPNDTKILVDGGPEDRALGFLIWKYRLDDPSNTVTIDWLVLSHGDADHVKGLIPILDHPQITVSRIVHNGIAVYASGFDEALGNVDAEDRLTPLHSSVADLGSATLAETFGKWIDAVDASGAVYEAVDFGTGVLDVGDPDIELEILGPVREPDGNSLKWFGSKSHTINGHSVVFRLTYDDVRTFFSGDLNIEGSKHLLEVDGMEGWLDSHIFKSSHHGSHEYHQALFDAVRPLITVVSSGDSPDHGHPRAVFLGAVGLAGRSSKPLIFSTEIAATFVDAGDAAAVAAAAISEPSTLGDLDFSLSESNGIARRRFKKTLPGIINVRTDGEDIYAARRVSAWYDWESYGPISPVDIPPDPGT